ncbi:MAG: DNA recombination protein RmuC [Clostridiales bacterium]|nr:DNA recombination protein RmuC [Clostridiales bacterium]
METLLILLTILSCISIIISLILTIMFIKNKNNKFAFDNSKELNNITTEINKLQNIVAIYNTTITEILKSYNDSTINNLNSISKNQFERLENLNKRLEVLTSSLENKLEKNTNVLELSLTSLRQNNEQKLEQMRMTVDEKLNESLEKRLNESFNLISERLENVSLGLGEMRSLAGSVGDLKKVLTNVKTRGTFGEVQLGNLLEQMLAPNQFSQNVMIKEDKRVDFVIYLPGKDDENLMLPIDAKFPIEDYTKILDAESEGNLEQVSQLSKALERRIKEEAKKINEKYILVPKTTDFAIMYLPLEGLYSEAIKRTGLIEQLQRDYKIIVCGPTTLSALLNSLQMGFQTLAIEKRSSEIWNLLSTFKKEFVTFVDLLTKTQKEIDKASGTIVDATKKTQKIQKQLDKVVLLDNNIDIIETDKADE